MTNVVFVKHSPAGKAYLFECPPYCTIEEGDTVVCNTARGDSMGTVVGEPLYLNPAQLATVAAAVRAQLPLKRVVGRQTIDRFAYKEGIPF